MAQLDVLEEQLGVGSRYDTGAERFGHLVRMSSARAGQRAVVLVDEYDKPILDALDVPEVARAKYRERGEPIHLSGGVQQGVPQPGGVRRRAGLTSKCSRRCARRRSAR